MCLCVFVCLCVCAFVFVCLRVHYLCPSILFHSLSFSINQVFTTEPQKFFSVPAASAQKHSGERAGYVSASVLCKQDNNSTYNESCLYLALPAPRDKFVINPPTHLSPPTHSPTHLTTRTNSPTHLSILLLTHRNTGWFTLRNTSQQPIIFSFRQRFSFFFIFFFFFFFFFL